MGARITGVGAFVLLIVCGVGVVGTMLPRTGLFSVSGATDTTMIMLGWNAWQVSYSTTADANQQLEAQGWSSPDIRQYGPLSRSYTRNTPFGVGELREWAFVWRDPLEPQLAHIRVRHWIDFPGWRNLLGTATVH